ncbi:MAG: xanthine dehydrogenase family protein molybdopterin-binding subunit, partial [Nitrososphaerales archaeon]
MTVQIGRESLIGKSLTRVDALEKVTGRAVYGDDIKMTGMLYGKILRSTRAHAKIKRIDVSKAQALEGVKAVVTGRDAPFRGGEALRDQPFLAVDKVRFVGEPVAAVAAVDERVAEEAIKLIEVEYEDLPAVFDVMDALKPDAPIIHEELHTYEHIPIVQPVPGTNICAKFEFERGNLEKGFAEADVVIEDTFTFAPSHHGQIEPFMAIAQVDYNGRITVWVPNDAPSRLRKDLSDAMKIPQDRIRIISPPYMGGGFGGKGGLKVEMVCIALAMKTECRPVKIKLTREETFEATLTRHGAVC